MVEYAVLVAVALVASGLTLFTGFGLGTLLMPAFALFVPVEAAVAATAVVHLANNIFKVLIVGRGADRGVVLRFGLPAAGAAAVGAGLLLLVAQVPPLFTWELAGREHAVTPVKLLIAALLAVFVVVEIRSPKAAERVARDRLWLGGLLSGFFGGLSGHQGALRSAFLASLGLETRAFVATAAWCSLIVDVLRVAVYIAVGATVWSGGFGAAEGGSGADPLVPAELIGPVAAACAAALLGVVLGSRLVDKVTVRGIQRLVATALALAAIALATGIV